VNINLSIFQVKSSQVKYFFIFGRYETTFQHKLCLAFDRRTSYKLHIAIHYKHSRLKLNVKLTNAIFKKNNGVKAERQAGSEMVHI